MTDLVARETFEESPHIKGEVRLTMLALTRQFTESRVPLWSAFVFLNDHDKSILELSSDSLGTDTKRYAHKCQQRIKELEWQNKEKDEMLDEVQGDYRRVLKENEEFQASIEKLSKELFRLSKDSEEKGRSLKERYQELRAQSSALRDLEARYQITGAAHDESQQKLEEKTNRFNQLNAKYNKKAATAQELASTVHRQSDRIKELESELEDMTFQQRGEINPQQLDIYKSKIRSLENETKSLKIQLRHKMNGGVSSRSYSSSPLSSAPLAPSSTSKGRKRSKSGATRSKGAKKTSSKYSKSGKPSKKLKLSNQEASTASAFSSSNADFGSHNQPYYNVDTGRVEHAYGNDASIDNSSYVEGKRAAPPLRYNEGKRAASSITNYKNSKRKSSGSGSSDGNRGKAKKSVRSLRQSTVSDSRQVKPISSFNQDINIFEYM